MGKRKEFIATVIADKMQKTIVAGVVRISKHPKYGRIIKKYNKFKVHDEKNIAKVGDQIKIQETRPLSKEKRFKLIAVIKKAERAETKPKETKNNPAS